MVFCNTNGGISKIESIGLLILFGAFIGYTIYMGKKESKNEIVEIKAEEKENNIIKNI
jgi:cbb3-type cytochrome oxidase subunit 3